MIFSIECPGLHFATANFWADIVNLQLTPSVNVIWHLKFFTNCEKLKQDHKSFVLRVQTPLSLSSEGVCHRGCDEGGAGAHHAQGAAGAARRRGHRQVVRGEEVVTKVAT